MSEAGVTSDERSRAMADPGTRAGLWRAWAVDREDAVRQQLADAYRSFARMLAAKAYSNRFSPELEFDDYLQFALIGLLESIDRFDAKRNIPFEAFAGPRIRGAVLNGVQTLSEKQSQISARVQARQDRARSLAIDGEAGGMAPRDPLQRLADIAIGLAIGVMLDDRGLYTDGEPADPSGTPYDRLEAAQLRARLRKLVDGLPEAERRVLHQHYYQQVAFEEIARNCGLTKGRISQIHHGALRRLRQLSADAESVVLVT